MREIHKGKPRREFTRPASGIIDVTVCAKSGLLRTGECNEGAVTLPFLSGTQPGQYCDYHGGASPYQARIPVRSVQYGGYDDDFLFGSLSMPSLPLDLLPELANNSNNRQQGNRNNRNTTTRNNQTSIRLQNNPLLDDDVSVIPDLQLDLDEPEEAPEEVMQEVVHITPIEAVKQSEIEPEELAEEAIADDTADDDLPSWNPLE
jgi:penicillin-binding protein 1A